MEKIVYVKAFAECASEKEYLEVSSFLKTILHTLDMAIERRHLGNDFQFTIEGAHPDSLTMTPSENELKKTFGL